MTIPGRLAALLAAVAVALAGCTGEIVDGSSDRREAAPTPRAGAQEPEPHGELICDEGTLAAIDGTIGGQLDAFASGDYEAALGFSSSRFRAVTDAERFGLLIAEAYPFLLDAGGHTSTYCVVNGDQAQVLVTVQGPEGTSEEMVYRMANEGGDWRIDVAGLVDPTGAEIPIDV